MNIDLALPLEVHKRIARTKAQRLCKQAQKEREKENRANGRPKSYDPSRDYTDVLMKMFPKFDDEQIEDVLHQLDGTKDSGKRDRILWYWEREHKLFQL
ncbi:hypothetical protein [Vibrio agarivorans]|uniref:hypothetical protein n=1 Tax=Vibrio agarivorans TaxID=153622 RepID=UPI0025B3BB78|nr:hypothetical protein [Vibrio agarivorans]MDN3659947.1 hypothetical protein [Vibrio agarivorans]